MKRTAPDPFSREKILAQAFNVKKNALVYCASTAVTHVGIA